MSLKQKVVKGVFWSSIQQFGGQGITFVISLFLARLLNPEEYGIIAMVNIFISLGSALSDSGMTQSIIRLKEPTQTDYSTVFFFNLIASVFVYLIVFFCAPLIALFYELPKLCLIIRVISLTFVINAMGNIQMTKLSKEMNFRALALLQLPSIILAGCLSIFLAYRGFGVWTLVYATIFRTVLVNIQAWFYSKWIPTRDFNKETLMFHFHFGYKLLLSGIIDTIYENAYTILIGKFFSPLVLGYYNRADTLKQLPVSNISSVIRQITFPLFAEIQNDDVKLKLVIKRINQLIIFLLGPILFFAAVLGDPLFRFLFSEKWLPSVPFFQIIVFSGVLYPIHAYNLTVLKVKGRSDLFLKLEIIKKVIVAIFIIIALQYGLYALIIMQVVMSFSMLYVNIHYSNMLIGYSFKQQLLDLLPVFTLNALASTFVWIVEKATCYFVPYDLVRVVIPSLLGVVFYLTTAYFIKLSPLMDLLLILQPQIQKIKLKLGYQSKN